MSSWLIVFAVWVTPSAAAVLTESQQTQLATATDGRQPDEPALYALLANLAESRDTEPVPETVPQPKWNQVLADPAAWRGQWITVEGQFAGRPRRMDLLRPGTDATWGKALTEWGIIVGGRDGQVVLVYFIDPTGRWAESSAEDGSPRPGTTVRLTGRFYKLWTDRDAEGNATTYLVVVATDWSRVNSAGGAGQSRSVIAAVMVAGVFVLVLALWWVRRVVHQPGAAAARRERVRQRLRETAADLDDFDDDEDSSELPRDTADALRELNDPPR